MASFDFVFSCRESWCSFTSFRTHARPHARCGHWVQEERCVPCLKSRLTPMTLICSLSCAKSSFGSDGLSHLDQTCQSGAIIVGWSEKPQLGAPKLSTLERLYWAQLARFVGFIEPFRFDKHDRSNETVGSKEPIEHGSNEPVGQRACKDQLELLNLV